MKLTILVNLLTLTALLGTLGCSSVPKEAEILLKPKSVELPVLMEQAAATEKSGTKDAAIKQYEEAAKAYPASKLPWARVAQIQFDAANYGEAIVAAQQVVSRDEKDKVAHSILSVSGLRVSTKALADLSRQNELSGSIRSEAQSLTKVLRESLGEQVLVPVATPRPAPPPPSVQPRPPARASAPAAPSAPSGGGNPFGALK
ncbi:tetratricopeptide repeat protein [Undibacterium sp.]|uniref:tetratricopeptide repeat protein n=1 Tax=Undibacterium sp. TaxID=1914977 RepID=UPI00374FE5D7